MEDFEIEKGRVKTPTLLLQRLDMAASYAEGFFIRKAIAQNEVERKAFDQIARRSPNLFQELLAGSGIYRITQDFLSRRRKLQLLRSYENSRLESLRRALWSLFIIEHGHALAFRDNGHVIDGISYKVDDFLTDHAGFSGLVITLPQRSRLIKAPTLISAFITGKIVRSGLDRFLSGIVEVPQAFTMDEIMKANFLPGGIWPKDEDDCHDDKRQYPGWAAPVSGKTKWESDKEILETGRIEPGYIFGVYPI